MQNKKTLITGIVIDKFIDTYSEKEYSEAWNKLQNFISEIKHDVRLYSESAFDAEWIDEVFCNILGYPKKLKSRESWTTNGSGKKEERIDGVFFSNDCNTVKMVIELKSLDTPDLFKKTGNLSPITQGAKYLFQTPSSEMAVVSNFDKVVIFNKKEDYRQSWSLFNLNYDEFKEFYLILSYRSFYGELTNLMIHQSNESEKPVDDDFYTLAATIHKTLKKTLASEYADDLFNKFFALAYLEDCGRLPSQTIKTIYNKKLDFTHNLRTHFEVFSKFFQMMKNGKSIREAMGIDIDTASLSLWKNISYLEKIKIPKQLIDQVILLSEYDLKSVPIEKLFFYLTKKILNPYDGITHFDGDEYEYQFEFYKNFLNNSIEYSLVDVCLAFTTGKYHDISNPFVALFNQLSTKTIIEHKCERIFCLDFKTLINRQEYWHSIINKYDLEDEEIVEKIKEYAYSIEIFEYSGYSYAIIRSTHYYVDVLEIIEADNVIKLDKKTINKRIKLLSQEEKLWLENYLSGCSTFDLFGTVVDTENEADFSFNFTTGEIILKHDFVKLLQQYEWLDDYNTSYFIKSKNMDLPFILQSKEFNKYLSLNDFKNIYDVKIATFLTEKDFIDNEKKLCKVKENIETYEYKLRKLKQDQDVDELEVIRIEKLLESLNDMIQLD